MKKLLTLLLGTTLVLCAGCSSEKSESSAQSSIPVSQVSDFQPSDTGSADQSSENGSSAQSAEYRQISQEEAKALMESESGYIILDVRTQQEFDEGHIPGAICVANEDITTNNIPELPDKSQLIFVYCRSGRRSKEAASKLADLGYTNIVEFGGIIDWTGPVELS